MALSDYKPERREILVKGEPLFSVQGLSLDTLAVLVRTHMPDFEAVFDLLTQGETPTEDFFSQISRIAVSIARQAPGLAANIIAVCSGEEVTEALVATARRLPFPTQVEAMTNIGDLTFREAGEVKKSLESLMSLIAALRMQGEKKTAAATQDVRMTKAALAASTSG